MLVQRDWEFSGVASFLGSCGDQISCHDSSSERACNVHVCKVKHVVALSCGDSVVRLDRVNVVARIRWEQHDVAWPSKGVELTKTTWGGEFSQENRRGVKLTVLWKLLCLVFVLPFPLPSSVLIVWFLSKVSPTLLCWKTYCFEPSGWRQVSWYCRSFQLH